MPCPQQIAPAQNNPHAGQQPNGNQPHFQPADLAGRIAVAADDAAVGVFLDRARVQAALNNNAPAPAAVIPAVAPGVGF